MKKVALMVIFMMAISLIYSCSSTKYISGKSPSTTNQKTNTKNQQQIKTSTLKYPVVNAISQAEKIKQITKTFKKVAQDIHFKFNSYALVPIHEYGINQNPKQTLDRIAKFMKEYPNTKIRIEGNCDERGTIEYNLALGEKRALAAKLYLISKGINPNRISIISYGKSRPLDPAHNPWAWAKNRRDHFVLIKK